MGLQLIFAVETNKTCKSDWIYIKDTIDRFYKCSANSLKLSTIYMNGKTNYLKMEKKIEERKNKFSGNSKVIFVIDTDNMSSNPDDLKLFKEIERYTN